MGFSGGSAVRRTASGNRSARGPLTLELLEGRQVLAAFVAGETYLVSTLADSGTGSLREAIIAANTNKGADAIDFSVAGTISLSSALPTITDSLEIDGSSAPGFSGRPRVTIDFQNNAGLIVSTGADGSVIQSLSLVDSSDAGISLAASGVTVAGNFIGLRADGSTMEGNRGDGVAILAGSHDNLIGNDDAVSGISYYNTHKGVTLTNGRRVTAWQGITASSTAGQYLMAGTVDGTLFGGQNLGQGILFDGTINGAKGTTYTVAYPNAKYTSAFGPDNLGNGRVRVVGSYFTPLDQQSQPQLHGFVYEGLASRLGGTTGYKTLDYDPGTYNGSVVHSTMGDLAVGVAGTVDAQSAFDPSLPTTAFIYNFKTQAYTPIEYPLGDSQTAASTSAFGVWQNDGSHYTICGSFKELLTGGAPNFPFGTAFLVDYDANTGEFSNWKSFHLPGDDGSRTLTHFDGLSSVEAGVYTLSGISSATDGSEKGAAWVNVRRNADNSFSDAIWVPLDDAAVPGTTTSNAVYGNQVVGIVYDGLVSRPYQATVQTGFQLSNVISGNRGNGVSITGVGTMNNHVAMNFIGTDVTGALRRGNGGNGVVITGGASNNVIGGEATGGNDPTDAVFVRPPQGNLISGNYANGVLISDGADSNEVAGNFVGTKASGKTALGNALDGVAIVGADNNRIVGTTLNQDPFVFYNVLAGNGGNGLRITDSNSTTVYANFMGIGADNQKPVPNGGNGMLVSGSSQGVTLGGVIPLGNVISGNTGNGLEISGTAGGVVSWNSFIGQVAFGGIAPNQKNGVLITSTNPGFQIDDESTHNTIRTCLVGGNKGNGIEITGAANGVQIIDTAVGTNSMISAPIPNKGSGIVIGGTAHNIAIGGFRPSVEGFDGNFGVHVGSSGGYGIEFRDLAYDIVVYNTAVGVGTSPTAGTDLSLAAKLPNRRGGILVGQGVTSVTLGGKLNERDAYSNAIAFNGGDGIRIAGASGISVLGSIIQSNAGGGVTLQGGENNQLGESGNANAIVTNGKWGVYASGSLAGSAVQGNQIRGNRGNGVVLRAAQGLLVGGTANGSGNTITRNKAFGLLATGNCSGSTVEGNTIERNTAGNLNVARSSGLVVVDYSLILGENESVTGVRGARGKKVILVGSYLPDNELRNPVMGQWWVGDLSTGVGQKVRVSPTFSGQTVTTSIYYGPNTDAFNPALGKNNIRVVGTYEYSESAVAGQHGVLYQGPANGVGGTWTQINVPDSVAGGTVTNTIPHSTMGTLVVGNYSVEGQQAGTASAFIYDIRTDTYQVFDSLWGGVTNLTSAYGIWQNGGPNSTSYMIVGGAVYEGANTAYMVHYDSATQTFSNKTFFPLGTGLAGDTHFEGINAAPGGYTLSATILSGGTANAAYAYVPVGSNGSFGAARWVPVHYPGSSFCSGDTVYQNVEMGICILPNPNPISPRYIQRTYKATVTVTGAPAGGATISIPKARQGFVGPTAGAQRFAQYGPTQVTSPDQLNQPIGQEKADEIAKALGLDKSQCFTEEQYLAFISGNGANGSGDPQQAALVDESVNLLTNSMVNPLNRDINGTPTQIYLGSYGLAVSKDGVWLDSLANQAEPTRRVNEVIAPGGYMDTWAAANGATASLDMLRKSAYTIQLPYGIVAQQENGPAQLAFYRNGFGSAVVGLSMTPPLWEVNFCLIYMLNPRLAANMPAQWNPIPAEVATALLNSQTGRVRFSDYASYFPRECVVANPI